MFDIGGGELLLILIFVLVAFGPKKIPELSRSLGRGIREFKKAQREFTDQINTAFVEEEMRSQRKPRPTNTVSQRTMARGPEETERLPDANHPMEPIVEVPARADAAIELQPMEPANGASTSEESIPAREPIPGTIARGGTPRIDHEAAGESHQSNDLNRV